MPLTVLSLKGELSGEELANAVINQGLNEANRATHNFFLRVRGRDCGIDVIHSRNHGEAPGHSATREDLPLSLCGLNVP